MRTCRHPRETLAILAALLLGLCATAAHAQDRLDPRIIISEQLTDAQQQEVEAYITHWSLQLLNGADEQVVLAKRRLMEPLGIGDASQAFIDLYSDTLVRRLDEAMRSNRLIVRLNAMIVVSRLPGGNALPRIRAGLGDENPAVRYWAAKAAHDIAEADGFAVGGQLDLLRMLTDQLQTEQSVPVVQQLMLAISVLEVPAAMQELPQALNGRVEAHVRSPGQPLEAEHAALYQLFLRLVRDETEGQAGVEGHIRDLALVTTRFMDLTVTQLAEGQVPSHLMPTYEKMLREGDQIMRFVHESMDVAASPPARIENAVEQKDWPFVRVQVEEWKRMLRGFPFNFNDRDLVLNPEG